jgi:hypothetical protein
MSTLIKTELGLAGPPEWDDKRTSNMQNFALHILTKSLTGIGHRHLHYQLEAPFSVILTHPLGRHQA